MHTEKYRRKFLSYARKKTFKKIRNSYQAENVTLFLRIWRQFVDELSTVLWNFILKKKERL